MTTPSESWCDRWVTGPRYRSPQATAPRPHHLSLDEAVSDVCQIPAGSSPRLEGQFQTLPFYRRLSVRLNGDYYANFTSLDLPSEAQIQDC